MDKLNTSDSDGRRFHVQNSIAHYRITAKLGQGGMGEVYRATDPKLGRDVAIKLLAPALAHDDVRMASVAREARTLAALNHPNIAAVYGIECEPAADSNPSHTGA